MFSNFVDPCKIVQNWIATWLATLEPPRTCRVPPGMCNPRIGIIVPLILETDMVCRLGSQNSIRALQRGTLRRLQFQQIQF